MVIYVCVALGLIGVSLKGYCTGYCKHRNYFILPMLVGIGHFVLSLGEIYHLNLRPSTLIFLMLGTLYAIVVLSRALVKECRVRY